MLSHRKHVRFADDFGGKLELVRVMTEPSDCPPKIDPSVIYRFRKAAKAFASLSPNRTQLFSIDKEDEAEFFTTKKLTTWEVGFIQPASQYIKFREDLEKNKVCLENIILRNEKSKIIGTIKVCTYILSTYYNTSYFRSSI